MSIKLLFLTLAIAVSSASAQSDIKSDGQDTLIFRDSTIMNVHVIEANRQTISYKIDQSSNETKYTSFYRVKEVRMGNGEILVGADQSNYTIPLGLLRGQYDDKSKRLGHLIISTHPTTLISYHEMDPKSTVLNIGLGYFISSNTSFNVYYYHGFGETRVQNNIERSNYYQNYPTFENGLEINAAIFTSKARAFDFGIRAGFFFGNLSYFSTNYNRISHYSPDNSSYHEYNGILYSFDNETFEEISTELKTQTYSSPFFNIELAAKISALISVSGSFGVNGIPYVYSDQFYNDVNWVSRYYDSAGNIVGEEYSPKSSNYGVLRIDPRVFARLTLNFHIPTIK